MENKDNLLICVDESIEKKYRCFCSMRNKKLDEVVMDALTEWIYKQNLNLSEEDILNNYCAIFKRGIIAAIKIGKKPTKKVVLNRRPQLKKLKTKELTDVINALAARKEI